MLARCRIAVLDGRCAVALAGYPEISAVLLERVERRAQRLARAQAIVALNRVDRRVLAMLWHLAERWGRMTGEGVLLPLDISHRLLGEPTGVPSGGVERLLSRRRLRVDERSPALDVD